MKKMYCAILAAVMCVSSTLCAQHLVTNLFAQTPYQQSVSAAQANAYLNMYDDMTDVYFPDKITFGIITGICEDVRAAMRRGEQGGFEEETSWIARKARFSDVLTSNLISFFEAYSKKLHELLVKHVYGKSVRPDAKKAVVHMLAALRQKEDVIKNASSKLRSKIKRYELLLDHWSKVLDNLSANRVVTVKLPF